MTRVTYETTLTE